MRRVFCVGRNYAEHAREMSNNPTREPPFFFTKPADALVEDGAVLPVPPQTKNLHYEAGLVVAIGTGGSDIATAQALAHVWGYAPGNELTRRDLQDIARALTFLRFAVRFKQSPESATLALAASPPK